MPTITRITAQKRSGRYNIDLDGHYAFPVAESTLIKYMLAKGMELTDAEVAALQHEDEGARAFSKAVGYLASTPRTIHQVQVYLADKDFPEEAITSAIDRLVDLKYLDDRAYAAEFIAANGRGGDRGPRMIQQWLKQRGVDDDTISDALANQSEADELAIARRVAHKILRSPGSRSFGALIQRVNQTLMQKGFSHNVIMAAIEAENPEEDSDREADLLRSQAEKIWAQKRTLEPYQRRMKTKQSLYRKGFDLDDIDRVLDDLE
ncbi:recombination regulator RecX [Lacticaseibacillus hulanensis]|uniref:recombination regulator RecX n=1 Tax=Lacticaseibacillus hulanensis TaxID=2493111 RepID=UPI0013E3A4B6|nr:recombination regulator RecX [Lacticaseibacillus hulanensis]